MSKGCEALSSLEEVTFIYIDISLWLHEVNEIGVSIRFVYALTGLTITITLLTIPCMNHCIYGLVIWLILDYNHSSLIYLEDTGNTISVWVPCSTDVLGKGIFSEIHVPSLLYAFLQERPVKKLNLCKYWKLDASMFIIFVLSKVTIYYQESTLFGVV